MLKSFYYSFFYQFYKIFKFCSKIAIIDWSVVLTMSILETFNIVTVLIKTDVDINISIVGVGVFIINYLIFINNDKYKIIIKDHLTENKKWGFVRLIFTLLYLCISTILFFKYV